jgi:hypothetical protein
MIGNKSKTMKHEQNKSQKVKTRQGLRVALIVACQTTKSCRPGKGTLHHPAPTAVHKNLDLYERIEGGKSQQKRG